MVLDVNLMRVVHGIHVFLPHIRAHGEGGHVVNIASMAGLNSGLGLALIPRASSRWSTSRRVWRCAQAARNWSDRPCPGFVRTRINESGRNRPERYGPARIPDPASPAGVLRTRIAEFTRSGLDPRMLPRKSFRPSETMNSTFLRIPAHVAARSWKSGFGAILAAMDKAATR